MSLRTYLQEHFVDKPTFTSIIGVLVHRLDELIAAKAIPQPSYICDGLSVRSAAFGTIETAEFHLGECFRPECARWGMIADQAILGGERDAVLSVLIAELRSGLCSHYNDSEIVERKIQSLLPHFFNGTFGLCVAAPSNRIAIAKKEILQERLTELTENGSNPSPHGISTSELLQLIDDYAMSAMPFSPAEYAHSSKKRLVDDLRPRVAIA